ncbi:MAG: alkaline phosphatase family protein [Bryobacteraceae bacterium]
MNPGRQAAQRVVLVAWPAADWSTVSPLLDAGALPHLQRLVERGVLAHVPGLFPEIEPLLYTSVATGVTADRHGILSAKECDPRTGELRPPLSTSRKTKAIWNILSDADRRSLVVNWPGQFPAEAIEGVSAAGDLFAVHGLQSARTAPPEAVFPAALGPALAGRCLHPSELRGDDLLPFIPLPAKVDQRRDRRAEALAQGLARAVSVHAATTWLMQNERWDFAAVSYGLIQAAWLQFGDCCGDEIYGRVLEAAYRFSDMMLGRIVALAGENAAILLVSASGLRTRGQKRPGVERVLPWYGTRGFCCIAGPGIHRDLLLHGASLLDIAPTILMLLGQPVPRDLTGRPLTQAFIDPPAPIFVSTRENTGAENTGERERAEAQASIEELSSLGYRDPAAERIRENTAAAVERERALNRAAVYLDTARPQQAIPVLRQLLQASPGDEVCGMALAYALIAAGEWAQLRELLPSVPENERTLPMLAVMRATMCVAGGNVAEALALLKTAERGGSGFPMLAYGIGCVYLRLRKWRRAERAFRAAAERNPEFWLAQQAQALALNHLGRRREAADLLRASINMNFAASGSHYLLGAALSDLGDRAGARRTFQNSLVPARAGR